MSIVRFTERIKIRAAELKEERCERNAVEEQLNELPEEMTRLGLNSNNERITLVILFFSFFFVSYH